MEDINTLMDQFGNELDDEQYSLLLDALSAYQSSTMSKDELLEIVRDFMDFAVIEELMQAIKDQYEQA